MVTADAARTARLAIAAATILRRSGWWIVRENVGSESVMGSLRGIRVRAVSPNAGRGV